MVFAPAKYMGCFNMGPVFAEDL